MTIPPIDTSDFDLLSDDLPSVTGGQMDLETAEIITNPDRLPSGADGFVEKPFPKAKIVLTEEQTNRLLADLDHWILSLESTWGPLRAKWSAMEKAYRAEGIPSKTFPFDGANGDIMPVIAMAVDPIVARLDTGIFKQDPPFRVRALRKSFTKYQEALQTFTNFWLKNIQGFRSTSLPRMFEFAKLGTTVFKTVYDRDESSFHTYDEDFKPHKEKVLSYAGPRIIGLSISDVLFPPGYNNAQECPIIIERIRTTYQKLCVAEASGKLVDTKKTFTARTSQLLNEYETALQEVSTQELNEPWLDQIVVYEAWWDYDINGDGMPERIVVTYEPKTRTILQLRYNWYFHQRKPYTILPYTVTNGTLLGLGVGEMTKPFQDSITKWHQMASDNAYLANIRMFVVKKGSNIEQAPRLYAGRVFTVADPKNDFLPFQAGDVYNSTLQERQNLFGMAEKRNGVSDYLTGRESPVLGSRATATSTLALIQEGTRRVEQVLENVRLAYSEIILNCYYIWAQYGLEGMDDAAFGTDEEATLVKEFFDTKITQQNLGGALAFDISATDAASNRQMQQQMQLAIIQQMQTYLQQVLQMGQAALMAEQQAPVYAEMLKEVMTASRNLYRDLMQTYDIKNPDEYLPDLEALIERAATLAQQGGVAGAGGQAPGLAPDGRVPAGGGAGAGEAGNGQGIAGNGGESVLRSLLAGGGAGPEGFSGGY